MRLVDKYIGLCPPYYRKENFYLQSLTKINPAQWYGEQVVGINLIKKVVKSLLGRANIEGYFTNHSLHRTGGTRLFQAGIERKIIKEVTGHSSDAIYGYQLTSDMQREEVSKVLASKDDGKVIEKEIKSKPKEKSVDKIELTQSIPVVSSVTSNGRTACSCSKTYTPNGNNFGDMKSSIIEGSRNARKQQ